MILNISGHQLELGETLQAFVKKKLEAKVKKFFKEAISVNVIFEKKNSLISAEIIVNDGIKHQALIRSNGKGQDWRTAFEDSINKIDIQLRKHKELVKGHHKNHHRNSE